MTNQHLFAEYGIQPSDTNLIADKLGLPPGDHSEDSVAQIRTMYSAAKNSNMSVKKYLASIEIDTPDRVQPTTPRVDRVQAPTDEAAVGDFHLAVRGAVSSIVGGSIQAFSELDGQLADHEEAVSTAFVERLSQSKGRSARLVIDKLRHADTEFFQFASTGAAQTFAERASAILALPDSGVPQYGGQPALSQATVVVHENDKGTQQSF